MGVSKMLERHINALRSIEGKKVEAGWFASNVYPNGQKIAYIATILEYGAVIQVQEHQQTIYRKIDERTGEFKNGGKFTTKAKSNFATEHTVAAHTIVIPPRPFMRKAGEDFKKSLPELQKKLGKKFLNDKLSADAMLEQIGLHLEGLIVNSMNNGGWIKNANSTIAQKGFDKPLKHWGTMMQTVTYKISS